MFRRRVSHDKIEAADPDDGQGAGSGGQGSGGDPLRGPADGDPGRGPARPWAPAPAGLDVSMPHPARVWNYWLGGRDFFAADKAAGEEAGRDFPHLADVARAERAFLVRAVRFLAGPARISQFLDIGAGLPAGGNTHEIAQRIAPRTGIVYADNDPAVILHAKTLLGSPMLASTPEGAVYYADADLRDVAAVLAAAASTLDIAKPTALILLGVLGHLEDYGAARSIVSQLTDALSAGSYLVIADGTATDPSAISAQLRYDHTARPRYGANAPAPYLLRKPDELTGFFDGLDLVEPGVVPCQRWRPDGRGADGADGADDVAAYCGLARKP